MSNRPIVFVLAVALSAFAVSCHPGHRDTGESQIRVSFAALTLADAVERVTVTVSGDGIDPPIVQDLVKREG